MEGILVLLFDLVILTYSQIQKIVWSMDAQINIIMLKHIGLRA